MKIKDTLAIHEEMAPLGYAESFDNVGLLVGDKNNDLTGILVCHDALETVIDEAISNKCNLVVCFHPILFNGLKKIKDRLNVSQPVYFSSISYGSNVYNESDQVLVNQIKTEEKVIVAGIAKPKPFFDFLEAYSAETMIFSDHHNFDEKEILTIINKAKNNKIITTEKDYVRLKDKLPKEQLYFLPIQSKFLNSSTDFDKKIIDYVEQSARNS